MLSNRFLKRCLFGTLAVELDESSGKKENGRKREKMSGILKKNHDTQKKRAFFISE